MNVRRRYPELCRRLESHPAALLRKEYLLRIEGRRADDPDVLALRRQACREEPLRALLQQRNPGGWWYNEKPASVYKKYEGTVWSLLFAAEMGAPADHPELRASCDFFLERCFVEANGAFETSARDSHTIACFVAHALYFLEYFGYGKDSRVHSAWRWLGDAVAADGGLRCFVMKPMLNATCVMALPKLLKAATMLTPARRKRTIGPALERALARLMATELDRYQPVESDRWLQLSYGKTPDEVRTLKTKFLKTLSGERRRKSTWSRFQFPLHYDSDLLEAMVMAGRLGVKKHPVLTEAARRIETMGGSDGWRAGRSLKGKMWADLPFEHDWISVRALEALKYYG